MEGFGPRQTVLKMKHPPPQFQIIFEEFDHKHFSEARLILQKRKSEGSFHSDAETTSHTLDLSQISEPMAFSSLSCPSAPSFSSQSWNHDVFLSFRGKYTHKTLVEHLYSALVLQGIHTCKDDKLIDTSPMQAILESQIAVVVFSENYADLSWCLDEVEQIMKCKDMIGKIVMPIFYDMDPSTVRNEKGKYGEAFSKHKLENKNKVEYWKEKKTLVDASNISGRELKNITNGHESKVIKEISRKLDG